MKSIQSNNLQEAERIIEIAKICFVGLADTDGTPYVLPMNFGYSNGVIYLHSAPEGTHLGVLERNNRVCITFCIGDQLVYQNEEMACSYRMRSDSAVCRGRVEFIEDVVGKTDAMHIMMSKYTDREFAYSMPSIKNVKVWKIQIESFSSKSFGLTHKEFLAKKEDQNQADK